MKQLNTLQDLFESQLRDAYGAEQQMIEALPDMIDAASSPEVKNALEEHLKETQQQAQRLEEIFDILDIESEAEKCDGMAGIIDEGKKLIKADGEPNVKDAALIAAAQKVEHYEIATYGALRTFAEILGDDDVAEMLAQTLGEESHAHKLLSKIATSGVNEQAPRG